MVGIVVVSHSHRLAQGVAELAREMGGPDLQLEIAGGLATEGNPTGTDTVLVMEAIERAWSGDGVLVLMDLGSAVLSAEMALDMLPQERRAKVLLCEAPLVEGAVAAAVAARVGSSLDEVAQEARGGLAGKAAHLGAGAPTPMAAPAARAPRAGPTRSIAITVANPHGLHARPAARFVQTASAFDADVLVTDRTTARGPVSARSMNAVATLGVVRGHEIEVSATGPEAEAAIEAIRALSARSFDEAPEEAVAVVSPPAGAEPEAAAPGTLRGIPASPGIAIGPARRFHVPDIEVADRPAEDRAEELRALDGAIEATRSDIEAQRTGAATRVGAYESAIFEAHLLFLGDEALLEPARRAIREEGLAAAPAWRDAVEEVAALWEGLDDRYLRARVDDMRSVGRQVLARLLGVPLPRPQLTEPGILVAGDLTPADTAGLEPARVLGIATAFGAPASHAAVIARALGIPAVVGAGEALLSIAEGTPLALDASAGIVHIAPGGDVAASLAARRAASEADLAEARRSASGPAVTTDGVTVEVAANIGGPQEATAAVQAGADAVGLFRTEFLFLEKGVPDEDEQEAAYRRAAEALGGRPMIVRTLDAGADKPVPGLDQPPEKNPFLGVRGIRLGLELPELLESQLRALLRVAADHPVRVMFPMVATRDELRAARAALERARARLRSDAHMDVGVMVEVPAAALMADVLAPEVDFFSIGTNDLTQYVLAADRGNERLATLADPLHPAVLRLIRRTVEAAETCGRWVGVCGELAGDLEATPVLIGLGVRELSMASPSIPVVKRAVRSIAARAAAALAHDALAQPTAGAVRDLLAGRR